MKNTCVNEYGKEINYAVAENLMDDDLREEIHRELAPCSEQRPGYTYKGWTVVPTGDDITDLAPDRQNKS